MKQILPFVLSFLIFPVSLNGFCQDTSLLKLKYELNKLANDGDLKGTTWGMCVMNSRSNEVVAEYNSSLKLLPASTLKLLASGISVFMLGPGFRFQTKLQYDGTIEKHGVLEGNLYILGSGDPSLGSARYKGRTSLDTVFKTWLNALKEKKIRQINGSVIADPDVFDDKPLAGSWMWEDIGNYYGSGASGLNVNEDLYNVWFRPGKNIGDSAPVMKFDPEIPGISYINRVTTAAAGTGDNVYIYGSPYTYLRFLEGTVPLGDDFPVRGSLPDPALTCATLFHNYLIKNGIIINESPTTTILQRYGGKEHQNKRENISTWESPVLTELIRQLNYWSINLYADCLTKVLGRIAGNGGSYQGGIITMTNYLAGKNLDMSQLTMVDGCGLSHLDRITPLLQAGILAAYTYENDFSSFYSNLAVTGVSGTLTYVLQGTAAEGMIHAKSGGLTDVKAYAGYVKNKKGDLLSFSIIFNCFNLTEDQLQPKIEKLMLKIAGL